MVARSSTPASTRAATSTRPTPTVATPTRTTKTVRFVVFVCEFEFTPLFRHVAKSLSTFVSVIKLIIFAINSLYR